MRNHKLHQIETDYGPENDMRPMERVTTLETPCEGIKEDNGMNTTAQSLTDKAKAVVDLANKALSSHDEGHLPALFNQIYRLWDGKRDGIHVSLQDHDGNVTPFVLVSQASIDKLVAINKIVDRINIEQFSLGHIEAVAHIVGLMTACEEAENEIVQFANKLYEKYGA